ncbi:12053_t:CDS:2 [Funneliformis geosporum]|uniref:13079_t:CDS:1 n=1 Tax=Funneliformis geosporum TaxID=1117311 RepID=A0A9W4WPR1_9GLOM|nr:12053_t:CDS:2 [Funneliformis geosporum]CAI2169716.1 13079_t:CDS:2 [Funneliformis geosporum]
MTQHSSNNRNFNIPNTGNPYHKTRGTHARVSRVRVTTVGKTCFSEKQLRSCPKCKESANNVKMLTARVGKIECLVNALAKTTQNLTSMSKREDRFAQHSRFGGLDLTRCSLQELQRLVVATTNIMVPSNNKLSQKSNQNPHPSITSDNINNDNAAEKTILHSEPIEDVKIFQETSSALPSSHHNQMQIAPTSPIRTATSVLKCKSLRQDSGFLESKHMLPSDNAENAENVQINGESRYSDD